MLNQKHKMLEKMSDLYVDSISERLDMQKSSVWDRNHTVSRLLVSVM